MTTVVTRRKLSNPAEQKSAVGGSRLCFRESVSPVNAEASLIFGEPSRVVNPASRNS
jgi:hypothetical protein